MYFSNGKVEWYETTNVNGEGVFLKPPPRIQMKMLRLNKSQIRKKPYLKAGKQLVKQTS